MYVDPVLHLRLSEVLEFRSAITQKQIYYESLAK